MTTTKTRSNKLIELTEKYRTIEAERVKAQQQQAVKIACTPVNSVTWKADRRMMAYPLFAPDKRNRIDVYKYTSPDGKWQITVIPHPELGRAKVWDADVFTYFLSRAYEAYCKTQQIPPVIQTTAYQVLKHLGKNPESTGNILWLRDAIRRLGGTYYQANLFDAFVEAGQSFNLLDYQFQKKARNGVPVVDKIIVKFNPELLACWMNDIKQILSLPKGVLEDCLKEQRSGLRKRLLLLIGTRLGNQASLVISLENLKGLCGYTRETKFFKASLKGILPTLPWNIEFAKRASGRGDNVIISQLKHLPLKQR
ncbi:MAG: replication initiator protein A [Cyanobacteria bacterium P01_D01_bin.56]